MKSPIANQTIQSIPVLHCFLFEKPDTRHKRKENIATSDVMPTCTSYLR